MIQNSLRCISGVAYMKIFLHLLSVVFPVVHKIFNIGTHLSLIDWLFLSYKEIALIMNKSVASVKGYCNTLSLQFKVNNRTELSHFCIKNGLVKLPAFYDKMVN